MTEHTQMPLVGPPMRRGWREILRFRPLTSSTSVALVVTQRGRVAGVIPANSPRALSDYLTWPYDFREVDTRERLLAIDQQLDSCDDGYEFGVALRLIYQVAQPDRAALDVEDVPVELAHALIQSLRLAGRSFGVEQAKAFEEQLGDLLLHNEALVQRVQELGLLLRRADVRVALDEHARAFAEQLRFAMRERPLHFQVAVESLETERSFDVLVGGVYRMIDRQVKNAPSDATEAAIQLAIVRILRRVGITYAPSDYTVAAQEMAKALRSDALLQSELSVAKVELLRPTVQIQPDRSMVHVPRASPPVLTDSRPEPTMRRLRAGPPRALPAPSIEAPPWAELSAASGRALPPSEPTVLSGEVVNDRDGTPPWANFGAASARALPPPGELSSEIDEAIGDAEDSPPWAGLMATVEQALPMPSEAEPASEYATSSAADAEPWADFAVAPDGLPPPLETREDAMRGFDVPSAWTDRSADGRHSTFLSTQSPDTFDGDVSDDGGLSSPWFGFASLSDGVPSAELAPAPGEMLSDADMVPAWIDRGIASDQLVPPVELSSPQAENAADAAFSWSDQGAEIDGLAIDDLLAEPDTIPRPDEQIQAWPSVSDRLDDRTPSTPAYTGAAELPMPADLPSAIAEPEDKLSIGEGDAAGSMNDESARLVVDEQITDMVELLESHGPAWFKMWVLELKQQPDRLPVILAEVTADTKLLAAAADPLKQTALLLALTAEPSPAAFSPAQLDVAPLPELARTPELADDQADLPDWLRLRAKWNGNGGGA
jgi:hypothetical protein